MSTDHVKVRVTLLFGPSAGPGLEALFSLELEGMKLTMAVPTGASCEARSSGIEGFISSVREIGGEEMATTLREQLNRRYCTP